jgi:hypothetical protein
MSKFEAFIRSRPIIDTPIQSRSKKFIETLRRNIGDTEWNLSLSGMTELKDNPGQMSNRVSITKYLPKSVSGQLGYVFTGQNYYQDHGSHDDFIWLKLNETKYPLRPFIKDVLIPYILSFDAYYSSIRLESLAINIVDIEDERIASGEESNLRSNLLWLNQVNFVDDLLFRRVFKITAEEAYERLIGQVELCQKLNDGILFGDQLDKCIDNIDEAIDQDRKYRKLLSGE